MRKHHTLWLTAFLVAATGCRASNGSYANHNAPSADGGAATVGGGGGSFSNVGIGSGQDCRGR